MTTTINVTKSFLFNSADSGIVTYDVGIHEVDQETAKHWYVQAHSTVVEKEIAKTEKVPTEEELQAQAQAEAEAIAKAEAEKKAAEEEAALKALTDADTKTAKTSKK